MIGICAAVEKASFGAWVDEPIAMIPVTYPRAIQRAGGIASMLPPDERATRAPDDVLDHLDALVLGGGVDVDPATHEAEPHVETGNTDPARDAFELALAHRALERDIPLLGVCRGMQILNVARGGTLEQHIPDLIGHNGHRPIPGSWAEHEVRIEPGSLAARASGAERMSVKSHHHQGVARLGEGVVPTAWSADDETIEAIEIAEPPFALGVLWHPEEDPEDRIIPTLLERAAD